MRLVVIDDHPLVQQGVGAIIGTQEDMEVVGMAGSGTEGIELLASLQPDVALVDLRLPGEYGLDIVKRGREVAPRCRFIVLTSYSEEGDVRRAMAEKVEGYILKEALPEELIAAIRLVGRGRTYIDPTIVQALMNQEENDPLSQLTPREKEVLAALAQGLSNRDIAAALYVTEHTVKKHVSQILEKLELTDRTQAALYALSHGFGPGQTSSRS
ncbi:MAG: response regulator [bacterium]